MTPEHLLPNPKQETQKAGLDPAFCYADGYYLFALRDRIAETSGAALSDSERHRLVEASKSQTKQNTQDEAQKTAIYREQHLAQFARHQHQLKTGETQAPIPGVCYNELGQEVNEAPEHRRERVAHHTPGTKTVIERRQWKGYDKFRVRTEVDTRPKVTAPEGKRNTTQLTRRAANKIADSCAFVAMERTGYSTFVTLTFNDEQREQINSGAVTIQKEVTRSLDGFKKVYERGMPKEGIPGNSDEFDYCWVVEIPKNSAGEDNPHVHLLMRWQVKHDQFQAWAKRLETLWGHGFAHIEKIKNPIDAGAYMAKAAGYFTKAQGNDSQGEVQGNRYGISKNARAPDWETFSECQMHVMGQLIQDIKESLEEEYGHLYEKRRALNSRKDQVNQELKTAKARANSQYAPTSDKLAKLTKERLMIGNALSKVRTDIQAIPARCNGYQLIIDGAANFYAFNGWAQGWEGHPSPDWLPEIPDGIYYKPGRRPTWEDAKDVVDLRKARRLRDRQKNAATDEELETMCLQYEGYQNEAMSCWREYEQLPHTSLYF